MGHRSYPLRAGPVGLALVVALASPASAENTATCSDQPDLGRPLRHARVVAEGPVPFIKSGEANPACPSLAPACRDKAYLVAGNGVIRSGSQEDVTCAIYVGATGQTRSGWLPARALADDAPAAVGLDDWVGTCTSGPEQTITIQRKRDRLALSGTASYGTQDPDRVRRGAINMGCFEAELRPDGPDLAWTDRDTGTVPVFNRDDSDACSVRMRLLPPDLVVESNAACGGMNVTFGGVYRRGG